MHHKQYSEKVVMEANKIGCRTCGGTSFTKTDKIAKCDYCGAEYDIEQFRARLACLEAEQKTLDSLADNVARLRELADQKEAERQKAIEEEEKQRQEELRKQKEAQKAYEEEQKKKKESAQQCGCSCATFLLLFALCCMGIQCKIILDPDIVVIMIIFSVIISIFIPIIISIMKD